MPGAVGAGERVDDRVDGGCMLALTAQMHIVVFVKPVDFRAGMVGL